MKVVAGLIILVLLLGCVEETSSDKVGAIIFLTGAQASLGEEVNNALILASEGKSLKLIVEDSEDNPTKAISAFEKLKSDGINKFIIAGDQVNYAIAPLVGENAVIIASVAASKEVKSNNTFRVWLTTKKQAEIIADFATNELKLEKISLIYINNVYGSEYESVLKEKVSVIASESYGIADSEVKTQVTKVISTNPDAIVVAGFGSAYSLVFKTLREQGYEGLILTDATLSIPFFFEGIGIENLDNVYYVSTIFDAKNPINDEMQKFVNDYKLKFELEPGWTGAFAYDSYNLLLQANKCDNGLKECLETISYNGVLGELRFEDGEVQVPLQIKNVENGKIVIVKKFD